MNADTFDEIILPGFDEAFGRLIEADGPLPPFAGWHMAPQRQPKPAPAIQPLVVPNRSLPAQQDASRRTGPSTTRSGRTSGTKRKRGQATAPPPVTHAGTSSYQSQSDPRSSASSQQQFRGSESHEPYPSASTSYPMPVPLNTSAHPRSPHLSVYTTVDQRSHSSHDGYSFHGSVSEASTRSALSTSTSPSSPEASQSSISGALSLSTMSPRTPNGQGSCALPTHGQAAPPPPPQMVGQHILFPGNHPSSHLHPTVPNPGAQRSASETRSDTMGPAPVKKRKTQTGFIILRPSTNGASLRVAASSASSFSDALDALRHRALPPESAGEGLDGDEGDDGWMGVLGAEKTLYVCPFDGCGRKYTFTSNLRRHMRRGHGLAKAGSQGGARSSAEGSSSAPGEGDDIEGDDGDESQ